MVFLFAILLLHLQVVLGTADTARLRSENKLLTKMLKELSVGGKSAQLSSEEEVSSLLGLANHELGWSEKPKVDICTRKECIDGCLYKGVCYSESEWRPTKFGCDKLGAGYWCVNGITQLSSEEEVGLDVMGLAMRSKNVGGWGIDRKSEVDICTRRECIDGCLYKGVCYSESEWGPTKFECDKLAIGFWCVDGIAQLSSEEEVSSLLGLAYHELGGGPKEDICVQKGCIDGCSYEHVCYAFSDSQWNLNRFACDKLGQGYWCIGGKALKGVGRQRTSMH